MSAILGLDVGDARIGIAVSNDRNFVHPCETINRKNISCDIQKIYKIINEHNIAQVVVGLPLMPSGEIGTQAKKVKKFAKALRKSIGNVKLIFWDERFTTIEAQQILRYLPKRKRRRKDLIDQASAIIILEEYLSTLAS